MSDQGLSGLQAAITPEAEQRPLRAATPNLKGGWVWGTGRRKSSVARVRMRPGTGELSINTRKLEEFFPTLGYLALTSKVDVLPMYLEGTHDALPKGSIFPKSKELNVRIGPAVSYSKMKAQAVGMARSESYRHVTRLVEEAVKALRDGKVLAVDENTKISEFFDERPARASRKGSES